MTAYYYGMKKAREAVAGLNAAQPLTVRFTPAEMAVLGVAVWLLLLLLEMTFLLILCSRPILPLLQGGKIHEKKRKG